VDNFGAGDEVGEIVEGNGDSSGLLRASWTGDRPGEYREDGQRKIRSHVIPRFVNPQSPFH